MKVKASESVAITLETYNKQYRSNYDTRLQKVCSISVYIGVYYVYIQRCILCILCILCVLWKKGVYNCNVE